MIVVWVFGRLALKYINKYVEGIAPYKLASQEVWAIAERKDVLKLDWNEATISPSPKVKISLQQHIETLPYNYYPNVRNVEFLTLLSDYTGLEREYLEYFSSSDGAHEYIARASLTEGDNVVILGPTYDHFRLTCQSMGANIHFHHLNDLRYFDESSFVSVVDQLKPKLVYICNPNNPTGTLIEPEVIGQLCKRFDEVLFVIDEAYYEFSERTCSKYIKLCQNLIITRTFSKAFMLANFRVGYVLASKALIETLNKIRNPKSVSSFAQAAAIAALSDLPYMRAYVSEVNDVKLRFLSALVSMSVNWFEVLSGEGNFVLLSFFCTKSKEEFIDWLKSDHIYVRDLSHVGGMENSIRITVGMGPQMARVVGQLKKLYERKNSHI